MRRTCLFLLTLAACSDEASGPGEPAAPGPCPDLTAGFVACGGDPTGSWEAQQGCISISLGQLEAEECPQEIPAELTPAGTVTFADGTETNEVTGELAATAAFTDGCLDALSGGLLPPATICGQIPGLAEEEGFTGNCVHRVACYCSLHGTAPAAGTRRYTVDGARLLDPDDLTRSVEFCVEGTTLTLRELDGNGLSTLLVLVRRE